MRLSLTTSVNSTAVLCIDAFNKKKFGSKIDGEMTEEQYCKFSTKNKKLLTRIAVLTKLCNPNFVLDNYFWEP